MEHVWQHTSKISNLNALPVPMLRQVSEVIINTLEMNANLKFNFHLDNPTYFQNFNLKIISNLMSGGRLGLGFRVRV